MNGTVLAEIKSTTSLTKSPFGSFDATLSVAVKDRDGEVVDGFAFDPLPDHLTIDVDHAMTVEKTVASGRPVYDRDGTLKFSGTYASHPLAQMVRSLVDEGHIKTVSVAFMNAVREIDSKDGLPHVRTAELLNAGIVAIPANTSALITASKALQRIGEGGTELVVPGHVRDTRNEKAVVGSFEHQRERLSVALRNAHPAADFVWVRATFADSVVYDLEQQGIAGTFQANYTDGEDGIEFGDAAQVDLGEVVLPTKSITDTNPEGKAAAADAAAAQPPAAVEVAKARATRLAAELALM